MPNDVLKKMTKDELVLWIKENLFLREKPKWSWVLDKRYQAAAEKEEAMRDDYEKIPSPDYGEYNALIDQLQTANNSQQSLSILKKLDKYNAAREKRNMERKGIDKQYQKTNNLFKKLQKAWEDERNERSKKNK